MCLYDTDMATSANHTISLRTPPAQRELIDRAARLVGKSRTDFMLEAAGSEQPRVVCIHPPSPRPPARRVDQRSHFAKAGLRELHVGERPPNRRRGRAGPPRTDEARSSPGRVAPTGHVRAA